MDKQWSAVRHRGFSLKRPQQPEQEEKTSARKEADWEAVYCPLLAEGCLTGTAGEAVPVGVRQLGVRQLPRPQRCHGTEAELEAELDQTGGF